MTLAPKWRKCKLIREQEQKAKSRMNPVSNSNQSDKMRWGQSNNLRYSWLPVLMETTHDFTNRWGKFRGNVSDYLLSFCLCAAKKYCISRLVQRNMSKVNVHNVKQHIHATEGMSNDGIVTMNHSAVPVFSLGESPSTRQLSFPSVFRSVRVLFDSFKHVSVLKPSRRSRRDAREQTHANLSK